MDKELEINASDAEFDDMSSEISTTDTDNLADCSSNASNCDSSVLDHDYLIIKY